jgi:Flp pilus assembly protein TadG
MAANRNRDGEKGAFSILVALSLVAIIGAAALAIDLGYMLVVRSELQNVADTGAMAADRKLAQLYETNNASSGWGTYVLSSGDRSTIESAVNSLTQANKAGGKAISVISSDFTYGKYNTTSHDIVATSPAYTGVLGIKVEARRDASANGVLSTLLARVLGIQSMSVHATSGASLSALGSVPAGTGLGIPVGIDQDWFAAHPGACGHRDKSGHGIRLYPATTASCAGWHTFTDSPASAARLGKIIDGLKDGSYTTPATTANSTYYQFTNGTIDTDFNNLNNLFQQKKGTDGTWTTLIPVYKSNSCNPPNGQQLIVGFATIWIYDVGSSPNKHMDVTVDCNVVDYGTGGGNDYGTLMGLPGMVE